MAKFTISRRLVVAGAIALTFTDPSMTLAHSPPAVADAGMAEAATALHYIEQAFEAGNIDVAQSDLQKAINCLVGLRDRRFSAAAANPCARQGKGALLDIKDASLGQELQFALGYASFGLKRTELTAVQTDALAAMDYMHSARDAWLFPVASGSVTVKHPDIKLRRGEIKLSQLKGAVVNNSEGGAIGTITDMVLDTKLHVIRLVGLKPKGHDRNVLAFHWSDLTLLSPVKPRSDYVFSLPSNIVAAAPRYEDEVHARLSYIDVQHNLVGRPVVAADGGTVGILIDLVIELQSGAVDYLLMSGNSAVGDTTSPLALQWRTIADLKIEHEIVLTLEEKQLAKAPTFSPSS